MRISDARIMALFVLLIAIQGCSPMRSARRTIARNIELGATAGAGFAGLRNVEVQERPAFASCTACRDTLLTDSVDLVANDFRQWRPALSTGLVAYLRSPITSLGGGIGTHIVFVPDSDGRTSPFPALTLHLGNPENEIFLGLILSPTDIIDLGEGRTRIRVRTQIEPDYGQFYKRNAGNSSHLYIGIQIKGTRQSLPDAERANPGSVGSIQIDPATLSLQVDASRQLEVTVRDTRNVAFRPALTFASSDPAIATVDAAGTVHGVAPGTATITVTANGVSQTIAVTVETLTCD